MSGIIPVEFRSATVADTRVDQRIIELIAVPYEESTQVIYREDVWNEVFTRGAFDGIESRQGRVPANRDHDMTRLVGKVVDWWPERSEGLVAEIRIAKSDLGNETLSLAEEDMLSASIGFGVRGRDQVLDKGNRVRRINRAFVDHLAFVAQPAYEGAKVLARRNEDAPPDAATLPRLNTPDLDDLVAFMASRKG